jgi:hypothetical protein
MVMVVMYRASKAEYPSSTTYPITPIMTVESIRKKARYILKKGLRKKYFLVI